MLPGKQHHSARVDAYCSATNQIQRHIRVLMVGTSYPESSSDWKGTFIRNIVESVATLNDVELSTWLPPGPLPGSVLRVTDNADAMWLSRLIKKGGISHAIRTQPLGGPWLSLQLLYRLRRGYRKNRLIDLRHVHWLQNAMPIQSDRLPLVVSVLGSDLSMLRVPCVTRILRKVFEARKSVLCPNANWMVDPLKSRFGKQTEIKVLPFGIGDKWYEIDRSRVSDRRWICVSRLTPDKIGTLFDWGEQVFRGSSRELHLFGPNQAAMAIPDWVYYHGSASPRDLHEKWFPQAAGLITLSRHSEGRPQVMLEAMASGLPIIASNIPAHDDFIEHGKTGWLCDDSEALLRGINHLSEHSANHAVGAAAKASAMKISGTWSTYAKRLRNIYEDVLE